MRGFNTLKKIIFCVAGGFAVIMVTSTMSLNVDSDAVMSGQKQMTASTYNKSKNMGSSGQETKETIEGFFKPKDDTLDDSATSGVDNTDNNDPVPYTPSTVDPGANNPVTPNTPSSDATIIGAAADVMSRAQAQGSTYHYGAGHGSETYQNIPMQMDCSAYVSLVLQEAGKIELGRIVSSQSCLTDIGGTLITDQNDLQPGDIVVTNCHVQIYAGDGKWYSWGEHSSQTAQPVPTNWTGLGSGQTYLGHIRY